MTTALDASTDAGPPSGDPLTTEAVSDELAARFGLTNIRLQHGLSQVELFRAAIANDRGRIELGGADDAQKAYATELGEDGPLVYYGDPTCTGRPVQDTFAVAWPDLVDEIWWKPDFKQFEPTAYEALLQRVLDHLNERNAELYSTDVFCGCCLLYTSPSPRDLSTSRMPSSA